MIGPFDGSSKDNLALARVGVLEPKLYLDRAEKQPGIFETEQEALERIQQGAENVAQYLERDDRLVIHVGNYEIRATVTSSEKRLARL